MDRAYEDNKTRALAEEHGFNVVVPPKKNRKDPWEYDKELYKKRNQVERYFLRIKRFRKVFTRYDKLDSIFLSVIMLAMIFDAHVFSEPCFLYLKSAICVKILMSAFCNTSFASSLLTIYLEQTPFR